MSKTTHTPGPWEAKNLGKSGTFPHVCIGPHLRYPDNSGTGFRARIVINEGPSPEDCARGTGLGTTTDTADANARLIAAAPELLAALELVRDTAKPLARKDGGEKIYSFDMQAVHAAIAKAKGAA